jgi:hypothetical protein
MGCNVRFGAANTSKSDENTLAIWERKITRKIFGSVTLNGVWGSRSTEELMDLYREPDIISEISIGKSRNSWLDNVENYMKKIGVRGCRKIARDRDNCKLILTEARVLRGL